MPDRVAIIGSRDYPDLGEVTAYVESLPAGTVVVSGGARGVDQTAEKAARARGLTVVSYRPVKHDKVWRVVRETFVGGAWERIPREATFPTFRQVAFFRNALIAEDCTRMVAFWDGRSRGTHNALGHARRFGRPFEVWVPDPERTRCLPI